VSAAPAGTGSGIVQWYCLAPGFRPSCLGATHSVGGTRKAGSMTSLDKRADRLMQVRAQLDYHRQRLVLYRRLHGSAPCARLAELEHAYASARRRLEDDASGVGRE